MAKRLVNIGDKFGTWEIIGLEENDKKYNYNYICKCSCGNKKIIRKDKLINSLFPRCDKCLSNGIIHDKWDLIKSRWNSKINGVLIFSNLQLKQRFTWNCPKGHRYRESILMLDEECPKCKEIEQLQMKLEHYNTWFDGLIDFLDHVCNNIWEDDYVIKVDENVKVIWLEVNGFIVVMTSNINRTYNDALHETKAKYFELQSIIKGYRQSAIKDEREHIFMNLDFSKRDFDKIRDILRLIKDK